jgi:hypothetical protein
MADFFKIPKRDCDGATTPQHQLLIFGEGFKASLQKLSEATLSGSDFENF